MPRMWPAVPPYRTSGHGQPQQGVSRVPEPGGETARQQIKPGRTADCIARRVAGEQAGLALRQFQACEPGVVCQRREGACERAYTRGYGGRAPLTEVERDPGATHSETRAGRRSGPGRTGQQRAPGHKCQGAQAAGKQHPLRLTRPVLTTMITLVDEPMKPASARTDTALLWRGAPGQLPLCGCVKGNWTCTLTGAARPPWQRPHGGAPPREHP